MGVAVIGIQSLYELRALIGRTAFTRRALFVASIACVVAGSVATAIVVIGRRQLEPKPVLKLPVPGYRILDIAFRPDRRQIVVVSNEIRKPSDFSATIFDFPDLKLIRT
jgi:hypothetical protein